MTAKGKLIMMTKGWELGSEYTFAKNIVGTLIFFKGDTIYSAEPEGKTWG